MPCPAADCWSAAVTAKQQLAHQATGGGGCWLHAGKCRREPSLAAPLAKESFMSKKNAAAQTQPAQQANQHDGLEVSRLRPTNRRPALRTAQWRCFAEARDPGSTKSAEPYGAPSAARNAPAHLAAPRRSISLLHGGSGGAAGAGAGRGCRPAARPVAPERAARVRLPEPHAARVGARLREPCLSGSSREAAQLP
jgi:hypothetical protein